jgi:copper resistance protein B
MRNEHAVRRRALRPLAMAVTLLLSAAAVAQHEQHAPPRAEVSAHSEEHSEHSEPSEHASHVADPAHELPEITAADRAAAFPDLSGMSMDGMMIEDPLNKLVLLDELETGRAGGADLVTWDLDTWIGRNLTKLWLRSEGERRGGNTQRADLEILWGRSFAPWWDLVAGARTDFAPGEDRSFAALGVRGLAPYRFDVEATAYLGDGGRTALRLDTAYEVLVTNKLILEPSIDLRWHGRTDAGRGIGAGLAEAELGLRLRYEARREVAPYIGLVRERRFGRTAELARAAGEDSDDSRLVVGIRLWF